MSGACLQRMKKSRSLSCAPLGHQLILFPAWGGASPLLRLRLPQAGFHCPFGANRNLKTQMGRLVHFLNSHLNPRRTFHRMALHAVGGIRETHPGNFASCDVQPDRLCTS